MFGLGCGVTHGVIHFCVSVGVRWVDIQGYYDVVVQFFLGQDRVFWGHIKQCVVKMAVEGDFFVVQRFQVGQVKDLEVFGIGKNWLILIYHVVEVI